MSSNQQDSALRHRVLVEDLLADLRNRRVLLFQNKGNAGDAVIAVGVTQCLDRLGIRYRIVGETAEVTGETVILSGGGNLVPPYRSTRMALEAFRGRARRMILLPHTIRGNEDLLATLGTEVTIVCRDIASYDHVLASTAGPLVLLAHDMAFHLDMSRFLFEAGDRAELNAVFRRTLKAKGVPLERLEAPSVRFLRTDGESAAAAPPEDTLDVSVLMFHGMAPDRVRLSAWCFAEMIRIAPDIVTDRLHVAIVAALLGKRCVLHDNSYGKNAEVFRHSLRGWFPTVTMERPAA